MPDIRAIIGIIYFKPDLQLDPVLEALQILIDETREKYDNDLFIIEGDLNAKVRDQDTSPREIFEETYLHEKKSSDHS